MGNIPENDRLVREQKRLEINTNIGRLEGFPSNELNTKRLKIRTVQVSTPVILPRSSSVPLEILDRLADDDESDLEIHEFGYELGSHK